MFQLLVLAIALYWNSMQIKMFTFILRVEIEAVRMTLDKKHFNYSKPKHYIAVLLMLKSFEEFSFLVYSCYSELYLFYIRISFESEILL